MPHTGTIIEESLEDKSVLKNLKILSTKVEEVTEEHKTTWVKQWTLYQVEILESEAESVAEKLSHALDSKHAWYADFKNKNTHFIIFRNKVFKINRSNPKEYEPVTKYGLTLGIPDHQLDFLPDIKDWQR